MRLWPWLVVGGVLVVSAAGWWWSRPRASQPRSSLPGAVTGVSGAVRDSGAPVRLRGRVVDEGGAPVRASISVYARAFAPEDDCPVCHAPLRSCDAPETVAHLTRTLREGLSPPPLLRTLETGPDGAFELDAVAPEAVLLIGAEGLVRRFVAARELAALTELVLSPNDDVVLSLVGEDGAPRTDAWGTLFEPLEGTSRRVTPDGEGRVRVRSTDPLAWVVFEAPGALSVGVEAIRDRRVALGPPRVVVVKTLRDGAPVDADVTLDFVGHRRALRTERGVARFEGLPPRGVIISANAGGLTSGERYEDLSERETVVELELVAAGSLVVSLETADGDPVAGGEVGLQSVLFSGEREIDAGALVIFERLPAGDYELVVDGPDFVREERRVAIAGGRETRVEMTVQPPMSISGTVVDARGEAVERFAVMVFDDDGEVVESHARPRQAGFEREVPHHGDFTVRVTSPLLGVGEARATVPGAPVTVRLQPKGVLEVRVRSPEGEDLTSSVRLQSATGWGRFVLERSPDGGWARNAALPSGEYEVGGEPRGFLPFHRTVHVEEGRTARVDLTADPGASISGRVIAEGWLRGQRVVVDGAEVYVSTLVDGEDGTFELGGLPAGPLELLSCDALGAPPKSFPAQAPSRGVVLRCPPPLMSHGRVIDRRGAPVSTFTVNGAEVHDGDGRFETPWTGQLSIISAGYLHFSLDDAGVELGDLTLRDETVIEGEVVTADGAPVSGASVRRSRWATAVRADGRGRFKLKVDDPERVEVLASLGPLSGSTMAEVGAFARVVLEPAVRVTGQIVDREGHGVIATVTADSPTGKVEFRADAAGRFSGELAEGVWVFNSRLLDGVRAIDIKPPATHVELGRTDATCGLTVEAPGRTMSVGWLLPEKPASLDVEPEPVANATVAMARGDTLVFSGVPCGAYSVVVAFAEPRARRGAFSLLGAMKPGYASDLITLRGNDERLVLPPP